MANKQSNSLNVIIITIAAMILLFTLVGRFINNSVERGANRGSHNQVKPMTKLSMIDFGSTQIIPNGNYWQPKTESDGFKNSRKYKRWTKLASSWNSLLSENSQSSIHIETQRIISTYFVQLYFSGMKSPVVAKIILLEDDKENNKQLVINFVASDTMVFKPKDFVYDLLPNTMLKEEYLESQQ